MKFNLLKSTLKIDKQFERIANLLFFEKKLEINGIENQIIELEFYYYSKKLNHLDGFTHPHTRDELELRFHFGGIDITFQSDENDYGGVLIRSVKNLKENKIINGPRRVIDELFKQMGKITSCSTINLIDKKSSEKYIIKGERHGLKNPNRKTPDDGKYRNHKYRFVTELTEENKVAGKEKLVRNQNLSKKLAFQFLGYNLKK